ncbi:right-handed parallel beta-helix repeat-containing protein [Listeria sp. SHR_NRA_18]|uniref:right-handed parallel beta-helix repeat-containing protein n=1 Tax=Listeria sp. SHR_NRA_18 TaxID=2269046 RepID=UPI00051D3D12|nr:right-handed parallel beta-helix repeat-containing protein [Listeria sp. SHR_NRA_18]KGL41260.1 hypothetical protein EP56_11785 [Listeriaceae bacterium FSL A5-0209]
MMQAKVVVGALLVFLTMMFSSGANASVELSPEMNSKMMDTALQKAKSSKVASEKVVTLPKGEMMLARTVVVPAGVTLRGASVSAMPALKIWKNESIPVVRMGSDTKLENVVLDGQKGKVVNQRHNGIEIVGASASQRVRNVQIVNSRIRNFGGNGIYMKYTDRVRIAGTTPAQMVVSAIGYAGIIGYSANNTTVQKVTVRDIGVMGERLAYNIALTEIYNSKLVASVQAKVNPRSDGAVITDSYILNNAVWEGIDTHHGRNLVIQNNTIVNVRNAIAVVSITLAGDVGTVSPPQNVMIRNNRINKQADYAKLKLVKSEKFKTVRGIVVSGAKLKKNRDAVYATGIQVLNNQVENVQAVSIYGGGIVMQSTFGAVVLGNRVQLESSGRTNYNGISLTVNNKRTAIIENYIGKIVAMPTEVIAFRGAHNNGEWNNAKWSKVSGYGMILSKNYRDVALFTDGKLNTRKAKLVTRIADPNSMVVRNTNKYTFKK